MIPLPTLLFMSCSNDSPTLRRSTSRQHHPTLQLNRHRVPLKRGRGSEGSNKRHAKAESVPPEPIPPIMLLPGERGRLFPCQSPVTFSSLRMFVASLRSKSRDMTMFILFCALVLTHTAPSFGRSPLFSEQPLTVTAATHEASLGWIAHG
jgi:hypothetical protein